MDRYFFRVEHELLRSDAFKALGGSAIKVYLVIGLYSDFGTGWAFPSIRTISTQAGLSRQTVLDAIDELVASGLLAIHKKPGKANAYRVLHPAPPRPTPIPRTGPEKRKSTVPDSLGLGAVTVPDSLDVTPRAGQETYEALVQFFGTRGHDLRPKQETRTKPENNDIPTLPIPGTPFRLTADGRLSVSVNLADLLAEQGIPRRMAERFALEKDPEAIAKVLLNAFYLKSQGKLQNGPGYVRAGIEEGYELLPQVATRLEQQRRELAQQMKQKASREEHTRRQSEQAEEEAAIQLVLQRMDPDELEMLVKQAIASLPRPLVQRNPTLSNPFIRARVYELACGEPLT